MIKFIDISNWQAGFDPATAPVDGVICKATEGLNYVDPKCDGFIQKTDGAGKLWGFYHFAGSGDPLAEAAFFYRNTMNYCGKGIPVLDWEGQQSVNWVNQFVNQYHNLTKVWPWIYANPWRFNQGGVETNCARWVASYPSVTAPTHETAAGWKCPAADGNVVAWQFASDCPVAGWKLDGDLFYGDAAAWNAYARGGRSIVDDVAANISTFENEAVKVTVEVKK
jgi:GH25 family lysozyme M1 (1,4-beta-N-acetylmuramidase)